jgi:hypothetical protein
MNKTSSNLWKSLSILGSQQGAMKVRDLSCQIGLSERETLIFLREIFPSGVGAEIYQKEGEQWVDFNAQSMEYMLPLTPQEWLLLREIVIISGYSGTQMEVYQSLKKKILDSSPIETIMNIFGHLQEWDNHLTENQQVIIQFIDKAVLEQKSIILEMKDEKKVRLFPCRIVHLEGELSLVAEDIFDHCLTVIAINKISSVNYEDHQFHLRATLFEIDEFISAIRSMNDRETRLILKIHQPQNVNLFPPYHFLGKPCMITNAHGDVIWAAYVEPCEDLFDWLLSLGTDVEVLDPVKFKTEFLTYCKAKLKKIA